MNRYKLTDQTMPADLIKKKKDKLTEWIQSETDEELIEFLSELKNQREKTDWWKKLSSTEKKIIQQGIDDADSGRIITSETFRMKEEQS